MPIRKLDRRFWKDLTSPRLQVLDLKSVYLSIRAKAPRRRRGEHQKIDESAGLS